ncbi:unnamed protein product [Mytilus coruscus]|uniref:C2H2-type domain-containing protein n=1 Tax=Mytilus coruscus TaxID=42192 RepID=A0A6J8CYQ1_MYTCO|nr:unnamed protein product [Mytilus coruscus]
MKVVNAVTNLDSGAKIVKCNIPAKTSLHNFKFTEDALVVWKAYNIGEDKNESTERNNQINKKAIFMCPIEGCVRECSTNSNLYNHLLLGNCDYKLEKQYLTNLVIIIYSQKINEGFPSSTSGHSSECGNIISTEGNIINSIGWALNSKRKKTVSLPHKSST